MRRPSSSPIDQVGRSYSQKAAPTAVDPALTGIGAGGEAEAAPPAGAHFAEFAVAWASCPLASSPLRTGRIWTVTLGLVGR